MQISILFIEFMFLFLFLPLFLLCYFVPKKIKTKNIILTIFSLAFYAYGEPYYIFLMIFMILVNYYLTMIMDKKKSKFILILLIIINLLSLFSFKYLNFCIDNINSIFIIFLNTRTH